MGRSHEQLWTFPLSTYGVEVAARRASRRWARRFGALADRAISRLQSAYPLTSQGVLIVPALAQGLGPWYGGMDGYASARAYGGLAIVGLNLAAAQRPPHSAGGVAADTPGAHVLRGFAGGMAVARSGTAWYAVKRNQSSPDLRERQRGSPARARGHLERSGRRPAR